MLVLTLAGVSTIVLIMCGVSIEKNEKISYIFFGVIGFLIVLGLSFGWLMLYSGQISPRVSLNEGHLYRAVSSVALSTEAAKKEGGKYVLCLEDEQATIRVMLSNEPLTDGTLVQWKDKKLIAVAFQPNGPLNTPVSVPIPTSE